MTRYFDLSAWLLANLPINTIFDEAQEVNDVDVPAALIEYDGDADGETMNPDERCEKYKITLLADRVGATQTEKMTAIATLERNLVQKAKGLERMNARWNHITCQFLDAKRGDGRAEYLVSLYVTGD